MVEMHAHFKGNVQGVGFRSTTKRLANQLGLKGIVRNVGGNRVEIIAQGEKRKLEELVEKLKTNFEHESLEVSVDYKEPQESFENFSIAL